MASQNENFGIMDEGYFVPRTEIISWVNDLLKINLTKIEELGSGAVYCQILDAIYPGKVALNKVNWKAKNDYEFLNNFKVLQAAFDKFGIKRHIEVEKLSKAKYQDNLEFIQWLKRYHDVNVPDKSVPYPAEERRGNIKLDFGFAEKIVVPKSFNGVGQVVPPKRTASKEKRAQSGASGQKDSAKRLASPHVEKPKTRIPSTEKRGSILEAKETKDVREGRDSKDHKRPPHPPTNMPPTPAQKARAEVKPETADESYRPSRGNAEQLAKYKKLVRDLQSKIEMITEVAHGHDEPELKIKLIEQILSIGGSRLDKVSDFVSSPSKHTKNIETVQTEQIEESIHYNESLPWQVKARVEEHIEKDPVEKMSRSMRSNGEDDQAF